MITRADLGACLDSWRMRPSLMAGSRSQLRILYDAFSVLPWADAQGGEAFSCCPGRKHWGVRLVLFCCCRNTRKGWHISLQVRLPPFFAHTLQAWTRLSHFHMH